MTRYRKSLSGAGMWSAVFGALLAFAAASQSAFAQFEELVKQVPRSANAVVILNLEKAKNSPMGQREGWAARIEKSFEEGLTRVPPQATQFVLAAELDFQGMEPMWQAAVLNLNSDVLIDKIAETYGGAEETILSRKAVALPGDGYAVALGTRTLAAARPANRQFVLRWLRETKPSGGPELSEYLVKAAGYSDNAGSEIIMAIDLEGAFALDRIFEYMKTKTWLEKEKANPNSVATLLYSAKGIRLGVKIGEKPLARVAVDFDAATDWTQPIAKQLLIEMLEDAGMKIDDLDQWTVEAKGKEIGLQGYLSPEGLRQVLSIVPSPAPTKNVAVEIPSEAAKLDPAAASQAHFKAVTKLLNELKIQKSNVRTFGEYHVWFDRYAGKIEQLPILGVDKELVDYSAYVAQQLRGGSNSVKTAGMREGQRDAHVQSSPDVYAYAYNSGYNNGYYGGYGVARYAPRADLQYEASQRRINRKEERGGAHMSMEQVRQNVIAATSGVRRNMTEKYQVEF